MFIGRAGTKAVAAKAILNPVNGTAPVKLLNPTDNPVVVHKGAKIVSIEVVDAPPLATSTVTALDDTEKKMHLTNVQHSGQWFAVAE